jgi:chemotaxis receptor (MCP) glutamine deamidase CheD
MIDPNRYHVASGSYRIDTQKPMILEAYLGTCVGVAVCDPVAGIGGLIHLLLPEPISTADVSHPGKYASTGFPAFLQSLYEAGASTENMKATVAGGALVGPINDSDLKLDIGGRTTDRVMQLIDAEKITLKELETGGFLRAASSWI